MAEKSEIRSTKFETNSNDKNTNDKNTNDKNTNDKNTNDKKKGLINSLHGFFCFEF